ncbi:MAG: nitroreductase family protein [Acidimicrobiales bacterium]
MDLEEAIRRRRMHRAFSPDPLGRPVLERLLRMAAAAPSAGFTQGVDWLVLESAVDRARFFEATCEAVWLAAPGPLGGLLRAPAILVPVADPTAYTSRYSESDKASSGLAGLPAESWPVSYWTVDAAMGVMLLLLAVEDAGLGALFFRLHRPVGVLLEAFAIPAGRQVIGAVAAGWKSDTGAPVQTQGVAAALGGQRGGRLASPPLGQPGRLRRRRRRPLEEVVHWGAW